MERYKITVVGIEKPGGSGSVVPLTGKQVRNIANIVLGLYPMAEVEVLEVGEDGNETGARLKSKAHDGTRF